MREFELWEQFWISSMQNFKLKQRLKLPEKAKKLVKELADAQSKVESLETQVITALLKVWGEKVKC